MPDKTIEDANAEIEKITQLYLKVRENKRALQAEFDAKIARFDEALGAAEQQLLSLVPRSTKSLRTRFGTIIVSVKRVADVADWPAFHAYIQETGRFDMLHKRVSNGVINEFIDDDENTKHTPPPGIMTRSERKLSVRAPSAKGARNAAYDD